uniref:Conserved domain protein n=1 Tax=Syphacia muris TaxID=451379 RepID=A0A0N5ACA2_9BILA
MSEFELPRCQFCLQLATAAESAGKIDFPKNGSSENRNEQKIRKINKSEIRKLNGAYCLHTVQERAFPRLACDVKRAEE